MAFLTHRRQTSQIYYYSTPGGYEVDFYLPKKKLAQNLSEASIRKREIRALEDAFKNLQAHSALILTDRNEMELSMNDMPVKIQSIAEWLVGQSF